MILIKKWENKKKSLKLLFKAKKNLQLPIFAFTIVGTKGLNFCVRDGNRCITFAIVTNLREIIP